MTRDRVGRDEFALTHDVLATMLGVRRASVSVAAETLQQRGAIRYRRGIVVVSDADLLSAAACECYETSKHAFERSLRDDDVAFDEELHTVLRG